MIVLEDLNTVWSSFDIWTPSSPGSPQESLAEESAGQRMLVKVLYKYTQYLVKLTTRTSIRAAATVTGTVQLRYKMACII